MLNDYQIIYVNVVLAPMCFASFAEKTNRHRFSLSVSTKSANQNTFLLIYQDDARGRQSLPRRPNDVNKTPRPSDTLCPLYSTVMVKLNDMCRLVFVVVVIMMRSMAPIAYECVMFEWGGLWVARRHSVPTPCNVTGFALIPEAHMSFENGVCCGRNGSLGRCVVCV